MKPLNFVRAPKYQGSTTPQEDAAGTGVTPTRHARALFLVPKMKDKENGETDSPEAEDGAEIEESVQRGETKLFLMLGRRNLMQRNKGTKKQKRPSKATGGNIVHFPPQKDS